jgi:hypothetical protein
MKVLNTLDLTKNQIINVVLDKRTSDPTSPVEGQIYYNETLDKVYFYNGTSWVDTNDGVQTISNASNGGVIIGGTAANPTISLNVDNSTLEISGNIVRIKDAGVGSTKLATNAVTSIKITDKNVLFSKIQDIPTMTVIGRTAAGTGVSSGISIINTNDMSGASGTNLATAGSIKAYVDSQVAAIGSLQGSVDASTSTNFPGSALTKKGDYWYVSVAGTIQGIVFNVGDVIIANIDNPTVTSANSYIFLETNRDQASTTLLGLVTLATNAEVQTGTDANKVVTPASLSSRTATETRTGIAEIATQAETNAGTDDTRIVTPLKLKTFFDTAVGGFAANIGNGVANSFVVTHNLNTLDVNTTLIEVSTGSQVLADISHTSVDSVTVTFSNAPTANQYRIIIKK